MNNGTYPTSELERKRKAVKDKFQQMFSADNVGQQSLDVLFVCCMEQEEVSKYLFHRDPDIITNEQMQELVHFRKEQLAKIIVSFMRGYIDAKMEQVLK